MMKRLLCMLLAVLLLAVFCVSCTPVGGDDGQTGVSNSEQVGGDMQASSAQTIPDSSYIGLWYDDEAKTNELIIYDITDDSVGISTGIYRMFGFSARAVMKDGVLCFGDGVSDYYEGPDGVLGHLTIGDGTVTVTYDSFGALDESGSLDGEFAEYIFTMREDGAEYVREALEMEQRSGQ